jgi:hypothetical protein
MNYILDHQQSDGWLGPTDAKDGWARFPLLLGYSFTHHQPSPSPPPLSYHVIAFINYNLSCQCLVAFVQYYEATNDNRVIPAMRKFFHAYWTVMFNNPMEEWAAARWQVHYHHQSYFSASNMIRCPSLVHVWLVGIGFWYICSMDVR